MELGLGSAWGALVQDPRRSVLYIDIAAKLPVGSRMRSGRWVQIRVDLEGDIRVGYVRWACGGAIEAQAHKENNGSGDGPLWQLAPAPGSPGERGAC